MDVDAPRGLLRCFDEMEDPRMDRTKHHSLGDILFITICAVICGADGWTEVEVFGNAKLDWLRTILALPNGIPSHDTFGRVFARLNPEQFERGFLRWTASLAETSGGRLIAIDGKTLRRSFDNANRRAAIHMVSAWCETNQWVLGQVATEEKSNEITAIPRLLKLIDVKDAVVTIDAMGCQKAIAKQIIEQRGDYVLQVKKNQPELHDLMVATFDELTGPGIGGASCEFHEDIDAGHGRVETRRIWTTDWTKWYQQRSEWVGLQGFVCVESVRQVNNEVSTTRAYYISSLNGQDAPGMLGYVRGHWGIENKLHWSLDVTFREDALRNRKGHSAENLSRVRRMTLNLLKKDTTCKAGIKGKRLKASLRQDYLLQILGLGI
jgi:predicted transposase YbfD/YdcC